MTRSLLLAAFVAGLAFAPAKADALLHNHLLKSVPAANSTVAAPKAITLWFSEKPETALSTITVKGTDSTAIKLGKVTAAAGEKNAITAPIEGTLKPGLYLVQYKTVGSDGHPVRGVIGFTVK